MLSIFSFVNICIESVDTYASIEITLDIRELVKDPRLGKFQERNYEYSYITAIGN